jgi:hypothetical protein
LFFRACLAFLFPALLGFPMPLGFTGLPELNRFGFSSPPPAFAAVAASAAIPATAAFRELFREVSLAALADGAGSASSESGMGPGTEAPAPQGPPGGSSAGGAFSLAKGSGVFRMFSGSRGHGAWSGGGA